jgi:HEAT repeat protein
VALGNIGDVKAVEPLIMKVGSTYLPGDVDQVIEALGKIGDTRAINPIVKFLGNPEGYCDKDNAVETLKKLGHEISRKDIKCKSWSEE